MGWLVRYTVVGALGAIVAVRVFEAAFSGLTGGVASAARSGLFVGIWTAITTGLGMRGSSERVKGLRQSARDASSRIDGR